MQKTFSAKSNPTMFPDTHGWFRMVVRITILTSQLDRILKTKKSVWGKLKALYSSQDAQVLCDLPINLKIGEEKVKLLI